MDPMAVEGTSEIARSSNAAVPVVNQQSEIARSSNAAVPVVNQQSVYKIDDGSFQNPNFGTVYDQRVNKNVTKYVMKINPPRRAESEESRSSGESSLPRPKGTVVLTRHIQFYETQAISGNSRIFRGQMYSKIIGSIPITVKILQDGERQRREARIFFSTPFHKNIVHRILADSFDYRGLPTIFIVMESCDHSLRDFIELKVEAGDLSFDSDHFMSLCRQIVAGLEFLHAHNVIHGDLNPTNILLTDHNTVAKIADFGLSKTSNDGQSSGNSQAGSDEWMPPEILMDPKALSLPADIFTLGLLLYYTLSCGTHPFGGRQSRAYRIKHKETPDLGELLVPNERRGRLLIESMLESDPSNRPTAGEVGQDAFFESRL